MLFYLQILILCSSLQPCLKLLLDPYTVVGMSALLPLMESMEVLMKTAQGRNIYVVDFVSALTTCMGDLSEMYEVESTTYTTSEFWSLNQILQFKHESIQMQWCTDMENPDSLPTLAFVCHKRQIFARQNEKKLDLATWGNVVAEVKADVHRKFCLFL